MAFLERAVREFPEDPDLRLGYAVALASSSSLDLARREALRAVELDDGDPVRLARLSRLLFSSVVLAFGLPRADEMGEDFVVAC